MMVISEKKGNDYVKCFQFYFESVTKDILIKSVIRSMILFCLDDSWHRSGCELPVKPAAYNRYGHDHGATSCYVDIPSIARNVVLEIRYDRQNTALTEPPVRF